MYRINGRALVSESEALEKTARYVDECIRRLSEAEKAFAAADDELVRSIASAKASLRSRQRTLRQAANALAAVAQAAADGDKDAILVCNNETNLKKDLVAKLVGGGANYVSADNLPIEVEIRP